MSKLLRTDSLTSRRIVQAFFDFLNAVEPAPGVDLEGLEVAKDCLTEVFQLDQLPDTERPEPNLLVNIFRSQERITETEVKVSRTERPQDGPSSENYAGSSSAMEKVQDDSGMSESDDSGVPKDELFGHFFDALEKIHFFGAHGGEDLVDRATCLFHDAVGEIERSESKLIDRKRLADALKILGNKAMQSSSYSGAIERYTCAIALREDDAIYYCNRAAAYTQMHKYSEAMKDCLKSIEIDPSYSKAYSRMGLAYYAQGKYSDAINKGFRKALELDPNNEAVKENIRVAEQKLVEEREQRNRYQDSGFHFGGEAGSAGAAASFGSFPANIASMFSNLGGNAAQNQNGQSRSAEDSNNGTGVCYVEGNSVPADVASLVENMARTFREQGSESMPFETVQPSSTSVNFESGEGIGRGTASFSYDIGNGGHTVEELNRAFSSMSGLFNPQPPPPQEGRPDSR